MRERRSFAERTRALDSDEVRKKYFLVYEGKSTELLYFDAVNALKTVIDINPIIELVPIIRSYSEDGWSNPKKVVDRMVKNITEYQSGEVSYETILNWIMEYLQDEGFIFNNTTLSRSVWSTLSWICVEKLHVSLEQVVNDPTSACNRIIDFFREKQAFGNVILDIGQIMNYGRFNYTEGFDKICFIVDRDKDSFTDTQYDYVVSKCEANNYGFYITNPCFEFWLLLHFPDIDTIDKNVLILNPMVSAKRRYVESELRKYLPEYKKTRYDANKLVKNIDIALSNEKIFCENIHELKTQVGCNIGILIEEMRNKLSLQ